MKKQLFKILLLLIALSLSVVFTVSCDLVFELLPGGEALCLHEKVNAGTCVSRESCASCGAVLGDFGDHGYIAESEPPTCTKDGTSKRVCRYCGDTQTTSSAPSLGHSYGEWTVIEQPGSDTVGLKERECSRCGLKERSEIAPHQHNLVYADARAATCESDGWEAYEYCTRCPYNNKSVIKATGHTYGSYVYNENGTHSRICTTDPSHVLTELCHSASSDVCEYCGAELVFAVRPGSSFYGYYALGEYPKGDNMQSLYRDFAAAAELFAASDADVAYDEGYYVIDEFNLDGYGLTFDEAVAVWKVFYVSSPAYYWLSSSTNIRGGDILLTIADDYSSAEYRRTCDAEIARITSECSSLVKADMTELEKAVAISAYIVSNMEYAYESDGKTPVSDMWAHSMAGFAMHKLGVCEVYAKTFTYLCSLNGIECAVGSGFSGDEPHSWNYVRIDGVWYGVDLTWTDNSGNTAVYDFFGLSDGAIFDDHTPHPSAPYGVNFIYEAPELSERNIELTALYKNGEYAGLYKNIDEAFAAMTDTQAEYTVDVGYYSSYMHKIAHVITVSETPKVKKLTLRGNSKYVGEEYLDNNTLVYMSSTSRLTLSSDVVFENLHFMHENSDSACYIELSEYTLTLSGQSVYLEGRVTGKNSSSSLVADTTRGAYVYGGVDVYRLKVKHDKIVLGSDSHVNYCSRNGIYVANGANVTVERYE